MDEYVGLTGSDLFFMRKLSPQDREISFDLHFDENGVLVDIVPNIGDKCTPTKGDCKVAPGIATAVSAHTHPRGERISSADLVVSLQQHPNFGGNRRLSMVVAPKGVYAYYPTKVILDEWGKASVKLQNRLQLMIKWIGHQLQDETQDGKTQRFESEMRQLGFSVSYIPYKKLSPSDIVVLKLG